MGIYCPACGAFVLMLFYLILCISLCEIRSSGVLACLNKSTGIAILHSLWHWHLHSDRCPSFGKFLDDGQCFVCRQVFLSPIVSEGDYRNMSVYPFSYQISMKSSEYCCHYMQWSCYIRGHDWTLSVWVMALYL